MRELHKTSFWESLIIQKRVIGALLTREITTRYGHNNIGLLWLLVEPLLMTLIMVLMWKLLEANNISTLNTVAFTITGYPMMMVWCSAPNRAIGSTPANMSLLCHRSVCVLDTIFACMLSEIAGATIVQIAITSVLIAARWTEIPADIFYTLLAWLLMAMSAIGLGLIICSVVFHFESFGRVWGTISFVMMLLSGVFFFVHSLPQQLQHYVLMLPMVHGTETFRAGYFGNSVTTYGNPWFILLCNLVLLPLGLAMVTKFSKGAEPQ